MRLVLLLLVACQQQHAPVSSCDDSLAGVWIAPSGQRWSMLDYGATLEAYPMFDDGVGSGAPRVIDLARGEPFAGEIKRRFMRDGDECVARAPIRVAKCKDDGLELVLADPQPPLSYAPCQWPQPAASRVEWWKR